MHTLGAIVLLIILVAAIMRVLRFTRAHPDAFGEALELIRLMIRRKLNR